ncbi:TonB-linked SusC/RagA family outer membrane protein [Thermoflavifilum aggregans]|uniref:TonB-linked SusC/RagA family outer membrane protein n=2 Tax=Thermoflavifilum aggregans TaxID=454188 RepID=A0A2M9CUU4_9BACT|nr:TonB-linked SusC/RagA family outer membrane protein [Thermoflavifilum aggregans]
MKSYAYYQLLFSKPWKKISLIMRITTVLMLILFLQVSARSYSQNERTFSFDFNSIRLGKALILIEKQSQYRFLYNNKVVEAGLHVNLQVKDASIDEVLHQIIPEGLTYQILPNHVVVILPAGEHVQVVRVSGVVRDSAGHPLAGVTVKIKGTSTGTVTDAEGRFSIEAPDQNAVLVFTYVGYQTMEVPVSSYTAGQELAITLHQMTSALNELVVVGYGTQRRSDITGSVTSVPEYRLSAQVPYTNVLQLMEGSVAGMQVSQPSAAPGRSANILVRGVNSINASTSPLVVVDGVPFSGASNDINPNDIASIEILKDASAMAIYGARGANGVILITTKRGATGKPVIHYNVYGGLEFMAHELTPMNGPEYIQKNITYAQQAGLNPIDTVRNASEKPNYYAGRTTDWIKEVSQQGYIHNHNLSISGGNEYIHYYLSGELLKEIGILKGYQYHRASVRANIDANITPWLTIGTSSYYTSNNYDGGHVNLTLAERQSPYGQEYNPDGTYAIYPMYPVGILFPNPLLGLYEPVINRANNLTGNFFLQIKPFIKGLQYKLNGSYSYMPSRYDDYTGRNMGDQIGTAHVNNSESKSWLVENILTYNRDFGKHHVDLTAVYSAQKDQNFYSNITGQNFVNDQLSFNNIGAAKVITASSGYSASTILSQLIRLNYNFSNKYLFTFTTRRDGYSGLGSETSKHGVFPSVAVGWNIADEKFMKPVRAVNALKLRISYGTTGKSSISPYQTLTTQGVVQYVFDGVTTIGFLASNLGNSKLKWETTTGTSIGVDFSLLNFRLNGTIEVYKNKTNNLLLRRQIPIITGYSSIWDNIGKLQNKGLDITLNTVNIQTHRFKWETNLNISINRNKLLQLYGDNKDDIGNRWFLGKSLYAVYDYKMIGVWQVGENHDVDPSAKPGYLKFADINGDGVINSSDRVYLGTSLPKWTGGMINTFHYGQFSLSVFVQTFQGALKNNPTLDWADQAYVYNLPRDVGYWTAENKSNTRPSLVYSNPRGYGYPSKDNFTRIKDVTLSYTFTSRMLQNWHLHDLMVYLSGRNLHTFTKWIGWDPETQNDGGSGYNPYDYPQVTYFILGINIGL